MYLLLVILVPRLVRELAGHHGDARWRARRLRVVVRQLHALPHELVHVRRRVGQVRRGVTHVVPACNRGARVVVSGGGGARKRSHTQSKRSSPVSGARGGARTHVVHGEEDDMWRFGRGRGELTPLLKRPGCRGGSRRLEASNGQEPSSYEQRPSSRGLADLHGGDGQIRRLHGAPNPKKPDIVLVIKFEPIIPPGVPRQ